MQITEIIKQQIENATAQNPVTSSKLIEIIKTRLGLTIGARKVRYIVAELREKNHLPILATKRGKLGYFYCNSEAEFDQYEKEIRAHSIKELTTLKLVRLNFFGGNQMDLIF